ncbi:hypothetical protein AVEN_222137-1, partial [Araneus ventricosus]
MSSSEDFDAWKFQLVQDVYWSQGNAISRDLTQGNPAGYKIYLVGKEMLHLDDFDAGKSSWYKMYTGRKEMLHLDDFDAGKSSWYKMYTT